MPKGLLRKIFFTIFTLLLTSSVVFADTSDFEFSNYTTISYETGTDYVTVNTRYLREVNNDKYYYPPTGDKTFFIPDIPNSTEEEIAQEREFKMDSISVVNSVDREVDYSTETDSTGIYVKVPNYKSTTAGSPFDITLSYKTHDLVTRVFDYVKITAPSLPEDVEFSSTNEGNNTVSKYSYFLDIVVEKDIPELIRVFPSKYSSEEADDHITYSFSQESRIGNTPVVEFGTSIIYKFEYIYNTPKTDDFIDPKISKHFKALSTNIFELSLPREYGETNQSVLIESISPTPTKISRDSEGNIIGTFEVPANTESEIKVVGYISLSRETFEDNEIFEDIDTDIYLNQIEEDTSLSKYLIPTTYWEVEDEYIQSEASNIAEGKYTILDLLEADYEYINEKLEYDQSKATSSNLRIGAKAALQGGASVCMEYSDAMITILRAQGIPARAAVGYAELNGEEETAEELLRHQWVQVWIPDYGWLTIDPTYEGSDKIMGAYIDRILWETFSGDSLSNIKVYSANVEKIVDNPDYNISIYAVETSPDSDLYEYTDFNRSNEIKEENENIPVFEWFNTFLKTTIVGKALVIVMPIALVVVVLTILIAIFKNIVKKKKPKKKSKDTKKKGQPTP
jgi:hypothetical protein